MIEDHEDLMQTILFQTIRVTNSGDLSVSQAITQAAQAPRDTIGDCDAKKALERNGIKIVRKRGDTERTVFFEPSVIEKTLLKYTEWKGTNIKQLLARVEGAQEHSAKLGGKQTHRGIAIPLDSIVEQNVLFKSLPLFRPKPGDFTIQRRTTVPDPPVSAVPYIFQIVPTSSVSPALSKNSS